MLSRKDERKAPPSPGSSSEGGSAEKEPGNKGTLTLDATCAPAHIRYPQDISLLNEGREFLERLIGRFCRCYGLPLPRRCRRQARKEYLAFAKCRKHTAKKVRAAIRKQLGYVRRDIGYLEGFMAQGLVPDRKDIPKFLTILKLYGQQKFMYDHKVHSVPDRIVSISQPWLRPIVRGKATAPVEFGAKFDLSLDTEGYGRIEKISFDPYNEWPRCRRPWSGSRNAPGTGTIRSGYWQTRYTGHAITAGTAKDTGYAFLAPVWGGQSL